MTDTASRNTAGAMISDLPGRPFLRASGPGLAEAGHGCDRHMRRSGKPEPDREAKSSASDSRTRDVSPLENRVGPLKPRAFQPLEPAKVLPFVVLAAALALAVPVAAQGTGVPDSAAPALAIPLAANDGGPRRWQLRAGESSSLHGAPSGDSAILMTLSPNDLLDNLGCLAPDNADTVWCEVRPMAGGAPGFVRAARLSPVSGPDGKVITGMDDSPQRAKRGDFDATSTIPCAQIEGQPMGSCIARVARSGGGDATVVVRFTNGFQRMLFFANGRFLRGDATMSGVGTDTDWRLVGDTHVIRVDDQRFDLPENLILGD